MFGFKLFAFKILCAIMQMKGEKIFQNCVVTEFSTGGNCRYQNEAFIFKKALLISECKNKTLYTC